MKGKGILLKKDGDIRRVEAELHRIYIHVIEREFPMSTPFVPVSPPFIYIRRVTFILLKIFD